MCEGASEGAKVRRCELQELTTLSIVRVATAATSQSAANDLFSHSRGHAACTVSSHGRRATLSRTSLLATFERVEARNLSFIGQA